MFPAESVTCAVMVWVPLARLLVKLPPVPIVPLMLEVQISLEVRSPSSVSDALPEKLMVVPYGKDEPVAGVLMTTLGGLFGGVVRPIPATLTRPSG